MKFVADFHIHSKYSRATSSTMDVESLSKWAKVKGVKVLGTGDFTHPQWLKELKEKLRPAEPGLFKFNDTRFILTSEISCIYSKKQKVRKIHIIVFAPSFEVVDKINAYLATIGNLKADGRPILGLDAKELAKIVLGICPDCLIVPAHIWTPWFSLFGSKSGFDTIEECFEDYSKYIFAVETGLSSNPAMNWRLSDLDRLTLISNSDCHSPQKIAREANVFDAELSYQGIVEAVKNKKLLYTIEFFPEEGKYHFDGHRACNVRFDPEESKKHNNICPVCRKPLTIGVLNRVEELADREEGFLPPKRTPFKSLIPLSEIIAEALRVGVVSKKVKKEYDNLIAHFRDELAVLLDASFEDMSACTSLRIAEGVIKSREGKVEINPGYDGVYGTVKIFSQEEEDRQVLLL
ncbi:endonuclease Q family protein [Patescibacteria group bacterium]|nr:endonuclease Q family protein [Patescibacteria group bacterium]